MGTESAVPLERIGALELFRFLPEDALLAIRNVMQARRVERGAVIIEQGAPANRAYALCMGSVRIVQTGTDGRQAILRFIGPGETFGTIALFTNHRYPADAIAVEASTILVWTESDLLALLNRYPGIASNVIRVLGARIAQLQDRVRELTTQRVEQLIAHALLRLSEQAGRAGTRGTTIEIPLRRQDLAEFAGTTLHTASRVLSAWKKEGLIATSGQRLIIHDLSAISALAQGDDLTA